MKNTIETLVSIIAIIAFVLLAAVFGGNDQIAAAVIMIMLAGVSTVAFMNLEANPEHGIVELLK